MWGSSKIVKAYSNSDEKRKKRMYHNQASTYGSDEPRWIRTGSRAVGAGSAIMRNVKCHNFVAVCRISVGLMFEVKDIRCLHDSDFALLPIAIVAFNHRKWYLPSFNTCDRVSPADVIFRVRVRGSLAVRSNSHKTETLGVIHNHQGLGQVSRQLRW